MPKRLTYWGSKTTRGRGWTPDGKILAISAAHEGMARQTIAYSIDPSSHRVRRLDYGPVGDIVVEGGNVALLSGTMMREPAHFKRYRGGTSGRLWLAHEGSSFQRLHESIKGHFSSPMLVGERLAFLSDHDGVGNIYSSLFDGSDLRQHTFHGDFYARNATSDGSRVVYQCGGKIWFLASLYEDPVLVDIRVPSLVSPPRSGLQTAIGNVLDADMSKTGDETVLNVRGTVHLIDHKSGDWTRLDDGGSRFRNSYPRVMGSNKVIWVSEGADEQELCIAKKRSGEAPVRLARGEIRRVEGLSVSPCGQVAAISTRDGRLLLVTLTSGAIREIASSQYGPVTGVDFSPDSELVAWSEPTAPTLSIIRIFDRSIGEVVDATSGRYQDTEPTFSADGRYLAFLSKRRFNPIYDQQVLELSFPYGPTPFVLPLEAPAARPFAGVVTASEASARQRPRLDAVGLMSRMWAVPVQDRLYSSLCKTRSGFAWISRSPSAAIGGDVFKGTTANSDAVLETLELSTSMVRAHTTNVEWLRTSGNGARAALKIRGVEDRLLILDDICGESSGKIELDLRRVAFQTDQRLEWAQELSEVGHAICHDFWDEATAADMWEDIEAKYSPLLANVQTQDDFVDLLWEVIGELATSHAYVISPPGQSTRMEPMGFLGAEFEMDDDDPGWRITRVLESVPDDPRAHGPLYDLGIREELQPRILSVNGTRVDHTTRPESLLVGTANRMVEVAVKCEGNREPRMLQIKPIADEGMLRYFRLMALRRSLVECLSGGRVGYIHVPDMLGNGWAQFHRDMSVEFQKDALVIDFRANHGGNTAQLVAEKLARRVVAWTMPRGRAPIPFPADAPRGPIVACVDENSGSGGDTIAALMRAMGIGKVVGARTWGGGVGFSCPHRLVDGTQITIPTSPLWMESIGWEVENQGVPPDVEVIVAPHDWSDVTDRQLETAVKLALDSVKFQPAAEPPPRLRGRQ